MEQVSVGRIGRPHGVRGEVTVEVRTDEPDQRFRRGARLVALAPRVGAPVPSELTVAGSRWHQGRLLLDFEGDIYGEELRLEFIERLRGEKRFDSVEALVDQMHRDVEATRRTAAL